MNYKRTVGFGYDKLINKYGLDSLKSLKKYNPKKSIKKYTFVKNYLLNDQRVQSILEIGSGSGLFLKFIRKCYLNRIKLIILFYQFLFDLIY